MDLVARVAVAAATYAIDKPYDYLVPASLAERARAGVRVTAPFGRGNKVSEGIILALSQESRREELKAVTEVLDDESVLGPGQIKLALWLRERYFCTLFDAAKALLPAGLWYRVREVCTLAVDRETALDFKAQIEEAFPGQEVELTDPLSLSVACHIGPGALAVACSRKISVR